MFTSWRFVLFTAFSLVSGPVAFAQVHDVRMSVSVLGAATGESARFYRLFDSTDVLRIRILIFNNSSSSMWVSHAALAESMNVELRADGREEVPTSNSWDPSVQLSAPSGAVAVPGQDILLAGGAGAVWILRLRRTNGEPFASGDYWLSIATRPEGAFRTPDGRLVRVTAPLATDLTVRLQQAATPAELALMYRTGAMAALRAGDQVAAQTGFEQALAVDQNDDLSRQSMAGIYMGQGRYKEASELLEVVLQRASPGDRNLLLQPLALAYVGMGDEQRASAVLKSAGFSEPRVAAMVDDFRSRTRKRP
jgi:tetratricopeptide (TPR) repeat protein